MPLSSTIFRFFNVKVLKILFLDFEGYIWAPLAKPFSTELSMEGTKQEWRMQHELELHVHVLCQQGPMVLYTFGIILQNVSKCYIFKRSKSFMKGTTNEQTFLLNIYKPLILLKACLTMFPLFKNPCTHVKKIIIKGCVFHFPLQFYKGTTWQKC